MQPFSFELLHVCKQTGARRGRIHTPHGTIETPVYMPVGTQASVKTMSPDELVEAGAQIILANTYHLHLRPGEDLVAEAGGVQKFSSWNRPMLTDSGGFQVFSLAQLRKIREEGVSFRSHLDGSAHFFSPETSIAIQEKLGADIIMQLDELSPWPCDVAEAARAMRRTLRWLERCMDAKTRDDQALFGIVQGAFYEETRRECAREMAKLNLPGYGIGGLSVGEPKNVMYAMLDAVCPELPAEKPRYLMGVGSPDCLVEGVLRGVDMFDCVMPTRNGRNGMLFTSEGIINIRNQKWRDDFSPVDPMGHCFADTAYTKAYLRHLTIAGEMMAAQIASLHNLAFYLWLVGEAREQILQGTFSEWKPVMVEKLSRRL